MRSTSQPRGGADAFQQAFGERLSDVLDLNSWQSGEGIDWIYQRVADEIAGAVRQETALWGPIRAEIFPRLRTRVGAPPDAGVYRATPEQLRQVHRDVLFPGGVEACDGTRRSHDTLPVTVSQLGVSLVAYSGKLGTWVHRLFRRDLRESFDDPVDEAVALLERRAERGGLNQSDRGDGLSELARRAILTYAERAILVRRGRAPWRLGHGTPAPYELLTGSAGTLDLMIEATRILEELVCRHRKFLFVASEPRDRLLLTIGNALRPLEFAIVDTLADRIRPTVEASEYFLPTASDTTVDGQRLSPRQWMARFMDKVASRVVAGVYRASELAPPQLFFAHEDHAQEAALIALADSVLQPVRGFPLLIDLADQICSAVFGPDSLEGPLQLAYTRASAPLRFLSERMTRGR